MYLDPQLRVSAPIKVSHSIEVPILEGSREQQELLRCMQVGDRSAADVVISVAWYDMSASGGGDEPEVIASGTINLRDLWGGKRDMQSRQVALLDDYQEKSMLTLSTSVIRTLERVMPPPRR